MAEAAGESTFSKETIDLLGQAERAIQRSVTLRKQAVENRSEAQSKAWQQELSFLSRARQCLAGKVAKRLNESVSIDD